MTPLRKCLVYGARRCSRFGRIGPQRLLTRRHSDSHCWCSASVFDDVAAKEEAPLLMTTVSSSEEDGSCRGRERRHWTGAYTASKSLWAGLAICSQQTNRCGASAPSCLQSDMAAANRCTPQATPQEVSGASPPTRPSPALRIPATQITSLEPSMAAR